MSAAPANPALAEALGRLPDLLAAHMALSFAAVFAALVVSLPLGVAVSRAPPVAGPVTAIASGVQTIPGLALLALMVPVFGGRIGFGPAFTALTLYGVLPILRNTIVGLGGIDRAVNEAARAVGMTWAQRLFRVELPLAAPVILAGVRTSAVWVVGAATLSTLVGASSLGDLIFSGLQTRTWTAVLVGCIGAAGLALALDQALRLSEAAARLRRKGLVAIAALAFLPFVIVALWPMFAGGLTAQRVAAQGQADGLARSLERVRLTVGAKTFTEQFILARLIEARLEAEGADVTLREGLGSTIVFDAVAAGEIDIYVDYTGTLWATVLREPEPVPREEMYTEIAARMPDEYGVAVLGRLGFENAYAFTMTRARAAELSVASIADLAPIAGDLTKGGDPEFFGRPEWTRVRDAYGLGAMRTQAMDSTFMYGAVQSGQVDVISAYTTDGRIDDYDLVLLDDPLGALPPYDAVILLSPEAAAQPGVIDALRPLLGAIPAEQMRAANARVDLQGQSPAQAAAWLDGEVEER
ncbi:MAG: ABC transporter permease/substrate-binding protein [Maricaulaceae bacterium]|jgi:osmoprotectant transport system permease protein